MQKVLSWKTRAKHSAQLYYRNLNSLNASSSGAKSQERILVLTPLLQKTITIEHLSLYFDLLDKTTYPNHLISIGLLIPTTVITQQPGATSMVELKGLIEQLQRRWFHAFHDITIYQRNFDFDFDASFSFRLEPYRRSMMARAKNYLLSAALQDDHSWVAWVGVDVVSYPTTIFEDLMRRNVDVIVPNSLRATKDGSFWAHDRNNWQETDTSLRLQMSVGADFIMLEGYRELATGRTLMVDMPTHLGPDHVVPLDGVGASFTLVKAQVHREGANFPSFPFQHQLDTEGFARMVQAMGYGLFGIPSYFVYHASS